MKAKIGLLLLLVLAVFQPCIAQKVQITSPKIENYTKGELELKIAPFGLENPIDVGEITADGTILFNWDNDISWIIKE